MSLSDEERNKIINDYMYGHLSDMCREIERAVLAKAAQQVQGDVESDLLPIDPHDHPECQVMLWSKQEIDWIKSYAAKCLKAMPAPKQEPVGEAPDRWQDKLELAHMKGQSFAGIDPSFSAAQECAMKMMPGLPPPQAAAIPEWIDRNKIAPNHEQGEKIIAFGSGYAFECEFDDGFWCSIGGDDFTHWMPLPAAPKPEEK